VKRSWPLDDQSTGLALSPEGTLVGTIAYMSPEQLESGVVDARTDIYALGALSYHLVCGRPPFVGDNAIAIGFAHLSEPVIPPRQLRRDVPATLDATILEALAKAPDDRPASAKAFIDKAFASA
jgi:serine/threonine-protein kinase